MVQMENKEVAPTEVTDVWLYVFTTNQPEAFPAPPVGLPDSCSFFFSSSKVRGGQEAVEWHVEGDALRCRLFLRLHASECRQDA